MALEKVAAHNVLKHAQGRQSQCVAWAERVDTSTYRFDKITCTECDGEGGSKGEGTHDEIHDRVYRHATECRQRYEQRAYRCFDADRKGDRFDCLAALHH
ncbi:hypothetical protein [Streptomyces sp. STR69]|uniref:hypothetical protein n=1 Tax=Streptomyces sp. STR69 TaxID=1796942 RepID=UPI0021C74A82|nr:hypothetical protein [Streptomyces sp. STR69]